MTEPGPRLGQSPEERAEELKRRHLEVRRREAQQRRRRTWVIVAAVALVVAVAAGVVAARAFGPWGAGQEPTAGATSAPPLLAPSASAASAEPSPSSSAPGAGDTGAGDTGAGAGEMSSPLPNLKGKTPPATPTADPSPTKKATATDEASLTSPSTPPPTPEPTPTPTAKPRFVVSRALGDLRALTHLGVRSGGSGAEKAGAALIARRLRAAGASTEIRTFKLSNGKTSRNVVARFPGATRKTIVLGAHMDSKAPSPGANDNASGCAALLEIARCLGKQRAFPTVEIVCFGTEEMIDANPDHHHYGSRHHVKAMSAGARKNAAGMISLDMIGYGPSFVVRSMGTGPQSMVKLLLRQAKTRGLHPSYLRDPSSVGWSDHEAFERAGIPAAWIEWRDDPVYHTTADTSSHVVAAKLRSAGQLVLGVLYGMDAGELERLGR